MSDTLTEKDTSQKYGCEELVTEIRELPRKAIERHQKRPLGTPEGVTELPLGELTWCPYLFQPRGTGSKAVTCEPLVKELGTELRLKAREGLDPLTVWWSGSEWVIIDGHHRAKAYSESKTWQQRNVPVTVFVGTYTEARREASKENRKPREGMSGGEQSTYAWRLVCDPAMHWTDIVAASGRQRSTVKKMEKRLRELQDTYPNRDIEELAQIPWSIIQQLDLSKPLDQGGSTSDDIEEEIEAIVTAMRKAAIRDLSKFPEVVVGVLNRLHPRMTQRLIEYGEWDDFYRERFEDLEAEQSVHL